MQNKIGLWILLFPEVTLFEFNVSTILVLIAILFLSST